MRRIQGSVPLALMAAAAFALVCSAVTTSSAPAQNPSAPDSSVIPPDQRDLPDEPLGPGPEVGAEPSQQQPPAGQPPAEQPPPSGTAPSAAAQADTTHAAQADTTAAAHADTTAAVHADSTAAAQADTTGAKADTSAFVPSGVVKPTAEAPFDTLSLPTTPPPTNSTAGPGISGAHAPTPPVTPPKQRVGVLGLHPAAILIGLAALNYFIVKWATD